jgi:DHA1 family bicyclomycin/chloramphenicol resistance-like MFS transporter
VPRKDAPTQAANPRAQATPRGPRPPSSHAPLGMTAFVVLMAALMALNATAIDIMLPALPEMRGAMGLVAENAEQFVITSYLVGFGAAQLFMGALSDRFGRRPVLIAGLAVYAVGGVVSVLAPDYALLLASRAAQGAGAAAPRIIVTAMIRDCYSGRTMAKVTSFTMMAFMAAPVFAPSIGQVLMLAGTWRWPFAFLAVYGGAVLLASAAFLPETLPKAWRRSLDLRTLGGGIASVLGTRQTMGYAFASGLFFSALFGFIASAQPILAELYGLGAWFPIVFGSVALFIALAAFINSQLVERFGMRLLSHAAVALFTAISGALAVLALTTTVPLWLLLGMLAAAMTLVGLVFANFNALAMEPQGAVAGIASSVIGGMTTLTGATGGFIIGQSFDGTIVPLAVGYAACGVATLLVLLITERGRLFQHGPAHPA